MRNLSWVKEEWMLALTLLTAGIFVFTGGPPKEAASLTLVWLLVVILISSFAVVKHAEAIAHKVGEPLGTLILTLSVTGLEVVIIAASMFNSKGNPALGRDAMFAVTMIILNGMVGVSLLLGGLRHHEQTYNLRGANSFLAVIMPLAVIGLILPNFTKSTIGPTFSPLQAVLLIVLALGLYCVFLAIQNARHKNYFITTSEEEEPIHIEAGELALSWHCILLAVYLVPLVYLCKQLAYPLDAGLAAIGAPIAMGGFLVAVLVLSPESVSAVRAAQKNLLQRSINILLGSVLATIGLTIPAVLIIGLVTGKTIVLGLEPAGIVLLVLTLMLSMHTFNSGRTNMLLGIVHILLFIAYIILLFDQPGYGALALRTH